MPVINRFPQENVESLISKVTELEKKVNDISEKLKDIISDTKTIILDLSDQTDSSVVMAQVDDITYSVDNAENPEQLEDDTYQIIIN